MATQDQLIAALGEAHAANDEDTAIHIAQLLHSGQFEPSKAPDKIATDGNTSGSPHGAAPTKPSALSSGSDTLQFGPWDTHIPLPAATADQLAGVGKAFHDIGQGIGQKVGLTSSRDVQESRDRDRELMSSRNGRFGDIAGNVLALAPATMIPGVNAGVGAAALGSVLGAMQPSTSLAEQYGNTATGGALGPVAGALPEAARLIKQIPGAQTVGNYVSSMLPRGSRRAATRILGDAANMEGSSDLARLNLEQAAKSGALAGKYGIRPTTAQVAQSPGIAQLDRTVRNEPRPTSSGFGERDAANTRAIDNILTDISGTPQDRLRAGAARDFQARTMYDDALNNPEHFVQPPTADMPSFENELAAKKGLPSADGTPSVNDPNAPPSGLNDMGVRLQELLKRPAMKDAMTNATRVAANFGKTLDERNLIQQMHYAKMHLDDQIGAALASGKTNDYRSLLDTKHELLGVMDDLSPAYKQARENFVSASRPVNRMEVGEELRRKYSPGLGDMGSTSRNPATFVNALRNGDDIAQSATGFGGAKLGSTLTPDDLAALDAAAHQLGAQSYAQNAERAVGSNTGQNLANKRALDEVGSVHSLMPPEGAGAAGVALALHHPALIPLSIAGTVTKNATKQKLAEALLNPEIARKMLAPHESLLQKYMPAGPMSPGVAAASLNADIDAGSVPSLADGGQPKKSTFWDLVQQAVKELSTPSSTDPQSAPVGTGAAKQAESQIGAYPAHVNQVIDAQS